MTYYKTLPLKCLMVALPVIMIWTSACQKEAPPPTEKIRAIKTITVSERASGAVRKFSGAIEAADSSNRFRSSVVWDADQFIRS